MTTTLVLELFAGFSAACFALWLAAQSLSSAPGSLSGALTPLRTPVLSYLQRPGLPGSIGLLLLRLSIGVMMIHHGHEKLADPQQFANTYVASLHLPFPLFFAYAAGFSELIGSWMVILGLFTPFGALALTATMATAAYQHILTAGLNIYVLELVVLYLGGSLAVLFNGPGRFSFDAGLACELFADLDNTTPVSTADQPSLSGNLTPVAIRVGASATPPQS